MLTKSLTLIEKARDGHRGFSLSASGALSPYFQMIDTRKVGADRDINISEIMTNDTLIRGAIINAGAGQVGILATFMDSSTGLITDPELVTFSTVGAVDAASLNAITNTAIEAYVISAGYTIVYDLNPYAANVARSFSNPSRAVNTAYQPSTTRDTMVNASVSITSTISLTTGQTGTVSLQYADNSGFTTNLVTVQSFSNGNTGSLTIGLNLSQVATAALTGIVPAGKYYRLLTTNVTGTPTYGTPVVQEVLL